MIIYVYECEECKRTKEVRHRMSKVGKMKVECECGKLMKIKPQPVAGWMMP